jgi:magnesium chelatase subunit I
VVVSGLTDKEERREVARRVRAYSANRHEFAARLAEATWQVAEEVNIARKRLAKVTVAPAAEQAALDLVDQLHIQSLRAEIVMLQAARARAAADGRETADVVDVVAVAVMALRLRYSPFIAKYVEERGREDQAIQEAIDVLALTDGTEAS